MSKKAKHINNSSSLRIKGTFNCDVIHTSMENWVSIGHAILYNNDNNNNNNNNDNNNNNNNNNDNNNK